MPTQQIPSNEELLTFSEQLKRRLIASTRSRKSGLPGELRQELCDALDYLAELALEASLLEQRRASQPAEFDSQEVITNNVDSPNAEADVASNSARAISESNTLSCSPTPCSLSAVDLSRIVSEAVASSLATWQAQLAESSLAPVEPPVSAVEGAEQAESNDLATMLLEDLEEELSDTRIQLSSANMQLLEYQGELKQYRELLERAESRISDVEVGRLQPSVCDDGLLDQLKIQLEETLNELAELQQQNTELAAELAQQVANSVTSSCAAGRGKDAQLSWEDRKLLILKQLETDPTVSAGHAEISDIDTIDSQDRIQLQEIMEASQKEIARRDAEIDELREIVQMQSEAKAGLAIGAAGVAQMFDSDELIQSERQKLQEIQREWEDKLRQAEIDLSMERAKIARERIAMEKEKEELNRLQSTSLPKEKCIENRWLRVLGLNSQPNE